MNTSPQPIQPQSASPQSISPTTQQEQGKIIPQLSKLMKGLFGNLGPGFITGAADDDPSGIGTYAQTGAIFGFSQLWLVWLTCPSMIVIQQMCGRIGMITGKGLAGVSWNITRKKFYT